jgi:O-antigen/teichoic acid export membrane protein
MSATVYSQPLPIAGHPSHRRAVPEILAVTGGKLLTLVSLLGCGMMTARALGPHEYGRFAAALSLLLLLDGVLGSPLDIATVRFAAVHAAQGDRVLRLMGALFRFKIIGGAVLTAAAVALPRFLAEGLFGSDSYSAMVSIAAMCLLPLLALRATAAFLQAQYRFASYAALDIVLALLRLLGMGVVTWLGWRVPAAYLAVYGATALLLFFLGLAIFRQRYLLAPWPQRHETRELLAYSGLTAGVVILGTITGRSDILVLQRAAGTGVSADAAGLYAVAAQLAGLGSIVTMYLGIAIQPRIVPMVRDGSIRKVLLLNAIIGGLVLTLVLPVIGMLASPLLHLFFGPRYTPAAPILQILLAGCCLDLFTVPVLLTLALQLHPKSAFLGELAVTLLFVALAPAIAAQGALSMAWLVTAIRFLKLLIYTVIAARYFSSKHIAADAK